MFEWRLACTKSAVSSLTKAGGYIYLSSSSDDGRTWTEPTATALVNNNSGIQALRLLSGSILIVFNNFQGGFARFPLSVALSDDNPKTFKWVRDLELMIGTSNTDQNSAATAGSDPFEEEDLDDDGEYSYPSVVQSADGKIHISYTFRRETIKYV